MRAACLVRLICSGVNIRSHYQCVLLCKTRVTSNVVVETVFGRLPFQMLARRPAILNPE
jgi:hypothetical protein